MKRWLVLALLGCAPVRAQQAPIPMSDELSGHPYAIQKTWVIGGSGSWDYLTLDASSHQLFIAHGPTVQVVDIETGVVAGTVTGFGEAHDVVLDPNGEVAYVSDGHDDAIRIFNRQTFQITATINVPCSPRSMALEPQSKLLLAICGPGILASRTPSRTPRATGSSTTPRSSSGTARTPYSEATETPSPDISHVVVFDTDAQAVLANIAVQGDFRTAQSDDDGHVYVTVGESENPSDVRTGARQKSAQRIARLDTIAISADAHKALDAQNKGPHDGSTVPPQALDWGADTNGENGHVQFIRLGAICQGPRGLAIDSHRMRLFVACENQKLVVVDGAEGAGGSTLASLTTGPGADAVAYDGTHNLIFVSNGGGYGSLTVIRQHVTDSYAVVQNLSTLPRARTMTVDSSTGEVYVVTSLYGARLSSPPVNGIGTLKTEAVSGSFEVLAIGNQ